MKMYQLLVFILIASLMSCDKNAPGKNETFFCQINGNAFRPEKDSHPIGGVGVNPLRTYWYPDEKQFAIFANSGVQFVGFNIKYKLSSIELKKYPITSAGESARGFYTKDNSLMKPEDLIAESGYIEITKVSGKFISGTFEFICKSNTGNEYKITKGQFNNVEF